MTEKKNTGPQEGIKGVVEDVKGKAKEAAGTVTGRDDLVREGKAQQDKADAQKDVAKKEAQAVVGSRRPPRLPRSARRRTSGRNSSIAKAQPATPAGLFLASLAAGLLSLRVGMLCVPTLFDAAYPQVLDEQPPRTDDEPGAGE